MNRKTLIILIVCCVVVLAALCAVLVGLNNRPAGNADVPNTTQQTDSTDGTVVDPTDDTNPVDLTSPTVSVEVDDNKEDSGNGGLGSGSTSIDFDDLLNGGKKPAEGTKPENKPDSGKQEENKPENKPEENKPEENKPGTTTPEETEPAETEPEEDKGNSGEKPKPGDIDVPLS